MTNLEVQDIRDLGFIQDEARNWIFTKSTIDNVKLDKNIQFTKVSTKYKQTLIDLEKGLTGNIKIYINNELMFNNTVMNKLDLENIINGATLGYEQTQSLLYGTTKLCG